MIPKNIFTLFFLFISIQVIASPPEQDYIYCSHEKHETHPGNQAFVEYIDKYIADLNKEKNNFHKFCDVNNDEDLGLDESLITARIIDAFKREGRTFRLCHEGIINGEVYPIIPSYEDFWLLDIVHDELGKFKFDDPSDNDVLIEGRGLILKHKGNIHFRRIVSSYKNQYQAATKSDDRIKIVNQAIAKTVEEKDIGFYRKTKEGNWRKASKNDILMQTFRILKEKDKKRKF